MIALNSSKISTTKTASKNKFHAGHAPVEQPFRNDLPNIENRPIKYISLVNSPKSNNYNFLKESQL